MIIGYKKIRSNVEAASWVCDDPLEDHVWVSELTISCQEAKVLEALQCDLANPCTVQWRYFVGFGTNKSQSENFFFEQTSNP